MGYIAPLSNKCIKPQSSLIIVAVGCRENGLTSWFRNTLHPQIGDKEWDASTISAYNKAVRMAVSEVRLTTSYMLSA